MASFAQKSDLRVEEIAGNAFHPLPVRGDPDPGDLHGAGLHLDDEKGHVADGPDSPKTSTLKKSHAYSVFH
jgi:hypothetical protein